MRKASNLSAAIGLITIYYGLFLLGVWALLRYLPEWREYLPFGGLEDLVANTASNAGEAMEIIRTAGPIDNVERNGAIKLAGALVGTTILIIPVSWVYLITTRVSRVDRSFVQTVVVLPLIVAGIAMIVQNSLGLAFSLAGVVAAVRFRFSLDEPSDALYIFTAIAVGLGAGIGALGIAMVVSIGFVYANLALWRLNYGANLNTPFFSFLTGREREDDDL